MAIRELATQFGIHRDTVFDQLRRAGVTPNRLDKLGEPEIATAATLYRSGLSLDAVGERVGVDARTVRRPLAQAGVPIRTRRGWS